MPDRHTQAGAGCPPNAVAAASVSVQTPENQPKSRPAILAPDGRTQVIERQRAADRAAGLPLHIPLPGRPELLRCIARAVDCQESRLLAALRRGWMLAQEAHHHMDVTNAHARLRGLRAAGIDIADEWVVTRDQMGRERRVKRYVINGAVSDSEVPSWV